MDGTIIQQGRFTSNGATKQIAVRSDFDWIKVYNETKMYSAAGGDFGAYYMFQRGMTNGRGMVWTKLGTGTDANQPLTVGQIADNAGFVAVDSSGAPLASAVAITATSNAVRPVVSTGDTSGLVAGDIVRLTGVTDAEDLSGYDFAIDTINVNTDFRIAGALATAPGAAGTAGAYRKVNFDPLFYPRHRFIANILRPQDVGGVANSTLITLTVPSGYKVGQEVRFVVPETSQGGVSDYGMVEINGLKGTITAVDDALATQTITVDIDSTGFTAFTFPTAAKAANALSKAMVVPIGMDTAQAISSSVDPLSDATDNQGLIGVDLVAGANSPGGQTAADSGLAANDVIYWIAGKSFSVDNQ